MYKSCIHFEVRRSKVKVIRTQNRKCLFSKFKSVVCHFLCYIFIRISAKYGLYIGSTSCINPVNFQVRTPNVKVTVRHNTKCDQCYNLQMARYSLNNSSIHPTYFLQTRQKAKTSLIHVPGRFDRELG